MGSNVGERQSKGAQKDVDEAELEVADWVDEAEEGGKLESEETGQDGREDHGDDDGSSNRNENGEEWSESGENVSAHHVCHGGASSLVGRGGVGRSLVGSWSRCSVLLISRGAVRVLWGTVSILRCTISVLRSGVFL